MLRVGGLAVLLLTACHGEEEGVARVVVVQGGRLEIHEMGTLEIGQRTSSEAAAPPACPDIVYRGNPVSCDGWCENGCNAAGCTGGCTPCHSNLAAEVGGRAASGCAGADADNSNCQASAYCSQETGNGVFCGDPACPAV